MRLKLGSLRIKMKIFQHQSQLSSAALFSFLLVSSFATSCFARISRNQTGPVLQDKDLARLSDKNVSPTQQTHSAFQNAGKVPGLEIWRIESFEPVLYPVNNHGKFYTGDSFIILKTNPTKEKTLFTWDIHFWLGLETSVDEAGAAAIYTIQLDNFLNGAPVQHREVQGHESALFLSYFKKGIRYEQGGVGSSFKHIVTNAAGQKRLFQVKGKRNIRVRPVNLSVSSMNQGDCFILDAGTEILIYIGVKSRHAEKLKAISVANQIRDQDHNGRSKVQIIDTFSSDIDTQSFFTVLGSGSSNAVPEETVAEDDVVFETSDENSVNLYKVSDQSGSLQIEACSMKLMLQEMLDTHDCFILDTESGIYVWIGKGATQKEKKEAMDKAQEMLDTKKYPAWAQIYRTVEGGETTQLKLYFYSWKDSQGAKHF